MQRSDVVVAGAGIIGLSIAWQLVRRSRLKILVLEKGVGVGEGSTGASSAVCRYRYSRDEMLALARDGIHAYRHWRDFTGLGQPRAVFQQDGVLWMPGADRHWADREVVRLQDHGIPAAVVDDVELAERFPALASCVLTPDSETGADHDCRGGGRHLLELEGGHVDPVSAAQDLVEACRGEGVDIRFRAPIRDVLSRGGRVQGIELDSGEKVATPCLVNATGPWCQALNAAAGIALPWDLAPTRIQILHLERPHAVPGHIPVTLDMAGGIYFRGQNRGQQLVVGSVLEADEQEAVADPDHYPQLPDDRFLQQKLHILHHRLPALPYRGRVRGYCGLYTVNRNDVHPVVGATGLDGFWVANGFSGHGFKLAPAIGALLAREITGCGAEFDTAVSADFLATDRAPLELHSRSVLA